MISRNDSSTWARQNNYLWALAWVLRHPEMTSAVIGASRVAQIEDAVGALNNLNFSAQELQKVDQVLAS